MPAILGGHLKASAATRGVFSGEVSRPHSVSDKDLIGFFFVPHFHSALLALCCLVLLCVRQLHVTYWKP